MVKTTAEVMAMNSTEYRKYHESLMQDNDGTSVAYVFFSVFVVLQCCIYVSIRERQHLPLRQYIFEYVILVFPMTLLLTLYTDYVVSLNIGILVFNLYKLLQHHDVLSLVNQLQLPNKFSSPRLKSITSMRSLTYMITVFCILAVDFNSFPRYLSKTEKYGYSVMDTGVGLFVQISGLVHKDWTSNNYAAVFKGNAKFTLALVFLGIFRFVSIKQLDYQEHVSEYGVHWNFFFTLAASKVIPTILLMILQSPLFLSILVLIIHETILYSGAQTFVFSDSPRTNFWSANREGISSCLGYVSMYLFAVYIKKELNNTSVTRYCLLLKLITISSILWLAAVVVNIYFPASRTLANAGYCFYLEAVLVSGLTYVTLFESIHDGSNSHSVGVPWILSTINKNGLVFFLIANLITGAVNLSVRTLIFSDTPTLLILNFYLMITLYLTTVLDKLIKS